jgi:hypothetical protein
MVVPKTSDLIRIRRICQRQLVAQVVEARRAA